MGKMKMKIRMRIKMRLSPRIRHVEDDEKGDEDEMWVTIRMKKRLSLKISMWRMMKTTVY